MYAIEGRSERSRIEQEKERVDGEIPSATGLIRNTGPTVYGAFGPVTLQTYDDPDPLAFRKTNLLSVLKHFTS